MATITATNSATVSLQSVLLKARLEQAKREANQAEARAQDLQVKADAAESQAQQSRGRVHDLSSLLTASLFNPMGQATGRLVNLSA